MNNIHKGKYCISCEGQFSQEGLINGDTRNKIISWTYVETIIDNRGSELRYEKKLNEYRRMVEIFGGIYTNVIRLESRKNVTDSFKYEFFSHAAESILILRIILLLSSID